MKPLYLLLCAWLCGPTVVTAGESLRVASTSTIVTDLLREVGGDRVTIVEMVTPGEDPHEFRPTARDMAKMGACPVIFASGKGMENFLDSVRDLSRGKSVVVEVGQSLPGIEGRAHAHCQGHSHGVSEDPHWWHSLENMKKAVEVVREALTKASPSDGEYFRIRAQAYLRSLEDLQKWTVSRLSGIPPAQRKLVTSHDALQYFAQENGFTIHALAGFSSQEEATARQVAELIKLIRREKVKAVFGGFTLNPKFLEQIRKETGAGMGGVLYVDGLGEGEASTFIGMYKSNVNTLVEGLK
ncbi:MAG: zinc ABC transporter substrate-binding protein [Verrucomicrobiae bacterium]|nr:zinc ABC transporter substrate-binding protein [Verrucomicrobiae bacterium]